MPVLVKAPKIFELDANDNTRRIVRLAKMGTFKKLLIEYTIETKVSLIQNTGEITLSKDSVLLAHEFSFETELEEYIIKGTVDGGFASLDIEFINIGENLSLTIEVRSI